MDTNLVLTSAQSLGGFQGIAYVLRGAIGFLSFLWILTIIRVSKDIYARTKSITLQIISILLVTLLTPIIGMPLYLVIRPIRYRK